MNVTVLVGRLTKEPELKKSGAGKAYVRFTLAVDRPFAKDTADFINCVAFGKTAEIIGEYVRKGHKFGVCGYLQMDAYEHNGEKRTAYTVVVSSFDFLQSKVADEPQYKKTKSDFREVAEIGQQENADEEFPF